MKNSALVLSVGGTISALIGSLGVDYAAWAARTMLACNIIVMALYALHATRKRTA